MNFAEIWDIASTIIAVAAMIASVTPTPKDDKVVANLYRFLIDIPGFNIWKAKDR